MWQVARQQSVRHYGMLEDFVSLVTEAVPQLLTDRQRSLLLLALRAKVTLCDPRAANLDKIHSVSEATQSDEEVAGCCSALSTLTERLTASPADRRRLLQEVFDHSFDSALQSLVSDFLSRIEQLFPVPDFKQAACWLDAAPTGLEDCLQEVDREDVTELLANQSCLLGRATSTVSQDTEKILLSAWSHPLFTKLTNPEPPPADTEVQSDPVLQLDVELVKVEVVVMTEDEQEDVEEAVIGRAASPVEQEASNESSAPGGNDCAPVIIGEDRLKDSPGNFADQSEDAGDPPPAHQQVLRVGPDGDRSLEPAAFTCRSGGRAPPPGAPPPRATPLQDTLLFPVQRHLQNQSRAAVAPAQPPGAARLPVRPVRQGVPPPVQPDQSQADPPGQRRVHLQQVRQGVRVGQGERRPPAAAPAAGPHLHRVRPDVQLSDAAAATPADSLGGGGGAMLQLPLL
uniref:TERF1-interacting nuclear factor 2 N-terminal domain-containing protein n=1 Tax=Dicentrarchus labrax TaxID=13489 RepID=A0A8C4NLT8_DICLA